jgi:hypothetical protein
VDLPYGSLEDWLGVPRGREGNERRREAVEANVKPLKVGQDIAEVDQVDTQVRPRSVRRLVRTEPWLTNHTDGKPQTNRLKGLARKGRQWRHTVRSGAATGN